MGSFFLVLKRLGYLTIRSSNFDAPHFCRDFQRRVHTNCFLFSNVTKHFIIHDLRASAQATKNADFGKVVDLDYDFDQLKVVDHSSEGAKFKEREPRRKSIRKRWQFKKPFKTEEEEMGLHVNKIGDEIALDPGKSESEPEKDSVEKKNLRISKDNNNFRNLMTTLKSRKLREKTNKTLLEGKRLIQDAISAGHKPLKIFFSRFSDLRTLNLPEDVDVIQVPYKTLNLWSDVITSQGVIGVFEIPKLGISDVRSNTIPLTVICDNVRDPGNLGAIIRIVAAVGGQELILTTGCVDIWDPKVLRAGAGAHFRLPIAHSLSWADIECTVPEGVQIVLADSAVPVVPDDELEAGNQEESQGRNYFKNPSDLAETLPLHCYTSFNFEREGAVIVLGGESSGLSDEAYQFAINRNGSRVYIPMGNSTESLNNAVSLGIISYEMRRQLNFLVNDEDPEETICKDDSAIEKSQ